jgi:hypothetical protein
MPRQKWHHPLLKCERKYNASIVRVMGFPCTEPPMRQTH